MFCFTLHLFIMATWVTYYNTPDLLTLQKFRGRADVNHSLLTTKRIIQSLMVLLKKRILMKSYRIQLVEKSGVNQLQDFRQEGLTTLHLYRLHIVRPHHYNRFIFLNSDIRYQRLIRWCSGVLRTLNYLCCFSSAQTFYTERIRFLNILCKDTNVITGFEVHQTHFVYLI